MGRNEKDDFPICVQESYGLTHRRLYQINPPKIDDPVLHYTVKDESKHWQSLTSFFMEVFLPHGYPESVSRDYIQYQIWDSIQAFASSISGSICTHAILKGVGVGDKSATVLSATISWLIKDGTSMIGRIVFAWLKGTKLDCDCKKWRLFADVLNDVAMLMDLISQYFPQNFTLIICVSGVFKSVVGVAGGSTRAALTQHQARQNNMADVSAKDSSQETLVNLLALMCSLIIIPFITESLVYTWIVFGTMTVVHLISNYYAVKSVVMETFNNARFEIFIRHYLGEGILNNNFLSVNEVNGRENVFFSVHPKIVSIHLGCSFQNVIQDKSIEYVQKVLNLYKNCDYLLSIDRKSHSTTINIALSNKASVKTQMEALYQSYVLDNLLKTAPFNKEALDDDRCFSYEIASKEYATKTFSYFQDVIKNNGFKIDNAVFDSDMWRIEW